MSWSCDLGRRERFKTVGATLTLKEHALFKSIAARMGKTPGQLAADLARKEIEKKQCELPNPESTAP